MNEYIPRSGHPLVDVHVAELHRDAARRRDRAARRAPRPRPRRRP